MAFNVQYVSSTTICIFVLHLCSCFVVIGRIINVSMIMMMTMTTLFLLPIFFTVSAEYDVLKMKLVDFMASYITKL